MASKDIKVDLNVGGTVDASGDISADGVLKSNQASGAEGGQIELATAPSGTLSGTNVTIDVYGNKLRFFESGGTNRGAYIPLDSTSSSVGTSLLGGTTGAMNASFTYASKQSNVSSDGTTLASVAITTNGYPIQVIATGDMENNSAGGWVTLQLYRGSTAIGNIVHAESSAGSENVPFALTAIDVPAAGTYTYSLKVNNVAGGTFNFGESNGPTITVVELSGPKGDPGSGGGIADIVSDTTPQLGGDLDAQGYSITNVEYITLDTTPASVPSTTGSIYWDVDMETANLQLPGATLQIGQEHIIRVKNSSGSVAIPDRTPVMFAGATGDTITVTPAISSNISTYPSDYFVGITTEEIPADGFGFVTQFGFVNNVNTNSWTVGTLLYVDPSTAGGLTSTRPAAPAWQTPVAAVTKQNASAGRMLVRAIPGIALNHIEGVEISSPADNELLAYNSADGTWINQTYNEAGLNKVFYQTTAPSSPAVGDVWVDSDSVSVGGTSNILLSGSGAGFSSTEEYSLDPADYRVSFSRASDTTKVFINGYNVSDSSFYVAEPSTLEVTFYKIPKDYIVKNTGTSGIVFYKVIYGNGIYVAVGSEGTIVTSTDLNTWTSRTSGVTSTIYDIAYGNGVFVYHTGTKTGVSSDGITWTTYSTPSSSIQYTILFGSSKFVLAGNAYLYSSDNGYTWTQEVNTRDLLGYANGNFIAYNNTTLYYSSDGLTWSSSTIPSSYLTACWYYNGNYYLSGNNILVSSDLSSFTTIAGTSPSSNAVLTGNIIASSGTVHNADDILQRGVLDYLYSRVTNYQYIKNALANGNVLFPGKDEILVYDGTVSVEDQRVILEKMVI